MIHLLLGAALAQAPPVPEGPGGEEAVTLPTDLAVVDAALRPFLAEARAAEEAGNLRKAEMTYRLVLLKDPTLGPAVLGLARVLTATGNGREAAQVLATLPNDAEAVAARALLLEEGDPETAIRLYAQLQTLELGRADPYLRQAALLAARDPEQAGELVTTYLALQDDPPDLPRLLRVAQGLKSASESSHPGPARELALDTAVRILETTRTRWPDLAGLSEATALLDRIAVEREASRLTGGGNVPLTPTLKARLEEARQQATGRHPDNALVILQEIVGRSPRSADAWAALGDVQSSLGHIAEAEQAWTAAVGLSPDDASLHARLGILLSTGYGGRRHREAELELKTALGLRPTWHELLYRLGRVRQEAGAWEEALATYRNYLAVEPSGPLAQDARTRVRDLSRATPPPPPTLALAPVRDPSFSEEAWHHYRIARVYRNRGDLPAASDELALALAATPAFPEALSFQAALELEQGHGAHAREAYLAVLALQPDNAQVLLTLGEMARSGGAVPEARDWFQRAATAGSPDAWYFLASLSADSRSYRQATRYLDAYFAGSTGGLVHEPALALQRRVERILLLYRVAVGGMLAFLLGVPLGVVIHRRTGAPLKLLLEKDPGSWHEVARLLSAIRHEVLKHNTTLLPDVATRLEASDGTAAPYAAQRLYGEKGVVRRFEAYLQALEEVGRRAGVRLNLRRRDPVLAPMHRAMTRLGRMERRLRHPRPSDTRRLARDLREVSGVLNEEGYRAIGTMLHGMCLLQVGPELFREVYSRVSAEPGLVGEAPAHLEVVTAGRPVPLRIFRRDLEDVATNLFRNALFALKEELAAGERRIGLHLVEELDPVTGLEHVALRFLDNAPRPLAEAILRGRGIERGLGLAADLLRRHQGVLSVESQPGWSKAVVVRLPRPDMESEGHPSEPGGTS